VPTAHFGFAHFGFAQCKSLSAFGKANANSATRNANGKASEQADAFAEANASRTRWQRLHFALTPTAQVVYGR
jgi:hypothetical protein